VPPAPKGRDRTISAYDYIGRREFSEKVSCSIRSSRVGGYVITVKFTESQESGGIISGFLGARVSCEEQKDSQFGQTRLENQAQSYRQRGKQFHHYTNAPVINYIINRKSMIFLSLLDDCWLALCSKVKP